MPVFMNISVESWIYDYFFRSNDYGAFILKTTYLDNYYSPPETHEQFEILKAKKPDEWAVYANGEWGKLKRGLVFPEYYICDSFPTECRRFGYGLDFGFNPDPTAMVKCGIIEDRLYIDETIYSLNLTSSTRYSAMVRAGVRNNDRIVSDNSPELIRELKQRGLLNIEAAKKGPGSIKAGIDFMSNYKIYITKDSVNVKKELDNYAWAVDKRTEQMTGDPIDEFNHAIDAARYWLTAQLTQPKTTQRYSYTN